jgi:hypothetical protein
VTFVGTFNFQDLVGHPWDFGWGLGFIPQNAWARFEKDKNHVEIIRANRVAYANPLKVAWGARN